MTGPGSLHTSYHGDRNSSPQISQECDAIKWTYYSPLPLQRVWQAQAHVLTCYFFLFLPSAHKHKHHELPSFLNSQSDFIA